MMNSHQWLELLKPVRRLSLLAAVLSCGVVIPASAEMPSPAQIAAEMAGKWELSTAERGKTCVMTLKADQISNAMKLDLEPNCPNALAFTKDITAWSVRGLDIVRLQNAQGDAVIDLTEVESGIWEGERPNEGVYILQNYDAARDSARSMDQMIGDWAVVRGDGTSICGLTLTNTETAAAKDNFDLYLKPRCDPMIASFKPVMWRLDRGELLMMSASGEAWHFEADDNAQWRRVPDIADPIILVRQ